MFWASVLLLCAALVLTEALLRVRWRRARRLLAGLPYLPTLPLIGNAHLLVMSAEKFILFIEKITKTINEKQLPFVIWTGPIPSVVVMDPAHVKKVNNACLEKPYVYGFMDSMFGNGLLTAPASLWKQSSKKLSGAFSSSVVAGYQDVFNALAHKMVFEMRREAGGAPFDVLQKYLMKISLEAIYKITVCKDGTGSELTVEYHRAFNRIMEIYAHRALNPLLHLESVYRLTSSYREEQKCADVVNTFAGKVKDLRRKEREKMKREYPEMSSQDHAKDKYRPYIDALLELSETDPLFTEEQILAEINTIIGAGHDTIAKAILISLVKIGKRPDVQAKLYAEIRDIFGDSKRPMDKEDLERMQYCEAVINEVLRLYPPGPMAFRNVEQDLILDSCTIPAGSTCIINIWGSGRSTRLWGDDAEQFRPERWLQRDYSEDAVLLAFSYGKRACIGKRYAMSFMKTLLAYCVRDLVFEAEAEELRFKFEVTLNVSAGSLIKVQIRQ